MRIAIATDTYLPQLSGISDSISLLVQSLARRGHDVRIYAPDVSGAEPDSSVCRQPAWMVPGSGGGLALVYPHGIHRDIKQFAPDIIHVHTSSFLGLAAMCAAKRFGIPLVGTDHTFPAEYLHYAGLDYRPFRSLVRKAAALYYNRCDYVTAPSRSMLSELSAYGFSRPAEVISNQIPSSLFKPLSRKAQLKDRFGLGPLTILVFGRIAIEKNLDVALDVFNMARESIDADLAVIGDGPHRAAFERGIHSRKLTSCVHMMGVLRGPSLVEAINACDILLITSLSETQSMTTIQAMACGLPVVAVREGGISEYVVDGWNGFLADHNDLHAMTAHVLKLLREPDLRERMSGRALSSTTKFDEDNIAAKFEKIYHLLLPPVDTAENKVAAKALI